jgi:hypothetical protein
MEKIQDSNYELIIYELELKVELDERAMKIVELKLKQLGDNFFNTAEKHALEVGKYD